MTTRRLILAAPALLGPALLSRPARAQNWQPERPVTMIVAFAPGGGTDVAARTLARFMERELGQPVVVHNRAGAGGEVGWSELARARPDGLTIGFVNTPNLVTIPIERQARYRLEDFSPIAMWWMIRAASGCCRTALGATSRTSSPPPGPPLAPSATARRAWAAMTTWPP